MITWIIRACLVLFLGTLIALVAGCERQDVVTSNAFAKEIDQLQQQVNDIKKKLEESSLEILLLKLDRDLYGSATFDPAEPEAYSRVEANTGSFLVTLKNVQPYLDGQRVTLTIGNPLAVTFNGFKLKAKWAARRPRYDSKDPEFRKKQQAWEQTKQEKEFSFTNRLRPGTWNRVSFVIAPAKADQFGELEVSITTNQLSMVEQK